MALRTCPKNGSRRREEAYKRAILARNPPPHVGGYRVQDLCGRFLPKASRIEPNRNKPRREFLLVNGSGFRVESWRNWARGYARFPDPFCFCRVKSNGLASRHSIIRAFPFPLHFDSVLRRRMTEAVIDP